MGVFEKQIYIAVLRIWLTLFPRHTNGNITLVRHGVDSFYEFKTNAVCENVFGRNTRLCLAVG